MSVKTGQVVNFCFLPNSTKFPEALLVEINRGNCVPGMPMKDMAASSSSPPSSPPQTSCSSSFSNGLLISMIGIVVTSSAIMLYHVLLVKFCMRRHTSSTTAAESDPGPRPFTGVEEKVLRTIPIFTFSSVKCDIDLDECVVCLGELEDEDAVRLLPNCKHAFHVTCIDQWFAAQTSCPLCRSPVVPEATESESVEDARSTVDSNPEIGEPATSSSIRESSMAREQPFGLCRHCASVMISPDRRPPPPPATRLKRSLSMDQSLIRTNLQADSSSSCSGSTLRRSCSGHLDHGSLSAKWLGSISRLRAWRGTSHGAILPY